MRKRCVSLLLCMAALVGLTLSLGCNAFAPERNQRRMQVVRSDTRRIPDEVDWILGFEEPSQLYEDTFPPFKY